MGGAHHRAGLGDLRDAGAGDPEIGDDRLALGVDDHVLRLEVAVDDAVAVGEARRLQHLADQPHRLLGGEPGVDQLLQGAPLHVLHRDVVGALELAAVVDGDDVGVLEPRRGFRLAAEPLDELAVLGEAAVQDLQRDPALKVSVVGEPDVRHPSRADPLQHPVTPVDDAALAHLRHASPPPCLVCLVISHSGSFPPRRGRSAPPRRCRTSSCTRPWRRSRSSGSWPGRSR